MPRPASVRWARSASPTASYDGSYPYLEPLLDSLISPATVISMGALYYVGAHRSLGALFPTFTDELRTGSRRRPSALTWSILVAASRWTECARRTAATLRS